MSEDRGQTTLDFAIGVSVFLVALLFTFAFVPGMLQPFTTGAQDETIAVNRVADDVTLGTAADPAQPYVLNGTCTATLFEATATTACGLEGDSVSTRLDLPRDQRVNVTIRLVDPAGTPEVACWNRTTQSAVERSGTCDANAVELVGGEPIPRGTSDSVTARRVASLGDRNVSVTVVMW